MSLAGKTIFISGGSRGIGLAIALRAARDGAKIALAAKTAEPHAKLEGTQLLKDNRGGVAERIGQEAGIFVERLRAPEFQEAASAFFAKRTPDFSRFS